MYFPDERLFQRLLKFRTNLIYIAFSTCQALIEYQRATSKKEALAAPFEVIQDKDCSGGLRFCCSTLLAIHCH